VICQMDNFPMSLSFTKSTTYSNLCFKVVDGETVIFLLYMDDLFLSGNKNLIAKSKRKLAA
jgi:hypothetical protein